MCFWPWARITSRDGVSRRLERQGAPTSVSGCALRYAVASRFQTRAPTPPKAHEFTLETIAKPAENPKTFYSLRNSGDFIGLARNPYPACGVVDCPVTGRQFHGR